MNDVKIRNELLRQGKKLGEIDVVNEEVAGLKEAVYDTADVDLAGQTAWNAHYIKDDGIVGSTANNGGYLIAAEKGYTYTAVIPEGNSGSFGIACFKTEGSAGNGGKTISFDKTQSGTVVTVTADEETGVVGVYCRTGLLERLIVTKSVAKVDKAFAALKGDIELQSSVASKHAQELAVLAAIADKTYQGRDLTQMHAAEIANYASPWEWIRQRIRDTNYDGIHVCDWIPFTTTNGMTMRAQVAGIDTYYRYGDPSTDHHIDFVSDTLWPTAFQMGLVAFNNGVSAEKKSPWLSSNGYLFLNSLAGEVPNEAKIGGIMQAVDYTSDGVYHYLPDELKNVIVDKRMYVPDRYKNGVITASDTYFQWASIGKIWVPFELEIVGSSPWGDARYSGLGQSQYPIFFDLKNRIKGTSKTSRSNWWTASTVSGSSETFVSISSSSIPNNYKRASDAIMAPVCFRIA